jgi:Fe-S cluster biosynthesis and repair protein YggX
MARMIKCIKLGREAEEHDFLPYPGEFGECIFENVSTEAWKRWLEQQKMLVNENRVNLADKKARDYLAQQMKRHFFADSADVAVGYIPPSHKSAMAPREQAPE